MRQLFNNSYGKIDLKEEKLSEINNYEPFKEGKLIFTLTPFTKQNYNKKKKKKFWRFDFMKDTL